MKMKFTVNLPKNWETFPKVKMSTIERNKNLFKILFWIAIISLFLWILSVPIGIWLGWVIFWKAFFSFLFMFLVFNWFYKGISKAYTEYIEILKKNDKIDENA